MRMLRNNRSIEAFQQALPQLRNVSSDVIEYHQSGKYGCNGVLHDGCQNRANTYVAYEYIVFEE